MTKSEPSGVIYSAAERYLPEATRALQRLRPEANVAELAPEVGRLALPDLDVAGVAALCRGQQGAAPIPFVRHLAAEHDVVPAGALGALAEVCAARAAAAWAEAPDLKPRLALQVWSSGRLTGPLTGPDGAASPLRAPDVRRDIEAVLAEQGMVVTRGGEGLVLTVCLTPAGASVGVTRSKDTLADWPGGRVVLGRPPEQVSRAEWKLEELFKLQGSELGALAELAQRGAAPAALDLGASPGGWTRILRLRGFEVWAIDPGELHPTVAADPGVHHIQTTAGRFLAEHEADFDIVVNDMRMVAERSVRVMVDAAARLKPDGLAVVTLKVAPKRPMVTVERCLAILGEVYEPIMVRQLFHNRNEVTVLARRR